MIRNRKPFASHFDITSARRTGRPTDGRALCPRAVEFHLVASEQLTTRGSVARATNHHARPERAAPQCLLENNSPRPLPIGARCDSDNDPVPTSRVTQLLRLSKQAPCELIARRARTFLPPRAAGWWWWCELVCGALRLHWGRVWFGALTRLFQCAPLGFGRRKQS